MRKLILLTIFAIATPCHAQMFWAGTQYGDTIDQVKQKLPNASLIGDSVELRKNGATAFLADRSVIASVEFQVFLEFNTSGLQKVALVAKDMLPAPDAIAAQDVLIRAMRERYGRVARTEDPGKAATQRMPLWMQWRSGNSNIMLVPQHESGKLQIFYSLNLEAQTKADEAAARQKAGKSDIKREAGKL